MVAGEGTGAGMISWRLRPDARRFVDAGDRIGRCRTCSARIVMLPNDRRQGYCFDCYDSLNVKTAEFV